ncbi:MAG: translocation/assembly module TamB domain-containing protein [Pseudomonadota bacterium]
MGCGERRFRLGGLLALSVASTLALPPARAQEDDDPGFIGRQIESALSGPGREARVRGFQGALSGRATMDSLTFADADGVWFQLEGAVLDWNRAALLRGRLSVNELSADRIVVARAPLPAPAEAGAAAPSPEASGFSVPEFPVAINIGAIELATLELGAPILGEEALFRLRGGAILEDGDADIDLSLARLEGPENRIGLDLAFDSTASTLALDLTVREGPGGLASTLIGIPGAPSLALDIDGTGPLNDYSAVIDLSTQGVQRLAGTVTLRGVDGDGLRFAADVGGDITPVIAPAYADFFGPDIALRLDGLRGGDGALTLEALDITARSLSLQGSAAIDADGLPERFALTGALADPDGGVVRLPAAAQVTLAGADLSAGYDRASGDAWTLDLTAQDVAAPGLALDALTIDGGGAISLDGQTSVTAELEYAASGLAPDDTALASALGQEIGGAADVTWQAEAPLTLTELTIGGADYGASVSGTATFANRTLVLDGQAQVDAQDLSRFSGVSGQELTGRATVALAGSGDVLGGTFDVTLDVDGTRLSIGQEVADRFLDGPVTIDARARRDLGGLSLDSFALDSTGLSASGAGTLGSGVSDLTFTTTLKDIALLDPRYAGALTVEGRAAEQTAGLFDVDVTLEGAYGLEGSVAGLVGTGDAQRQTAVTLDLALPDLAPFVPDVPGPVSLRGQAASAGAGLWEVDLEATAPEGVDLEIEGQVGGGASVVDVAARVPDVAAFVPGIPGAVALDGRAEEQGNGQWQLDLSAGLPYAASAAVQGEAGPQDIRLSYAARVPDVSAIAPGLEGALSAIGAVRQTDPGRFDVTANIDGPYASQVTAQAQLGGGVDGSGRIVASVDVAVPDLGPVAPALSGPLTATARAEQTDAGAFAVDLDARGPFGATVEAQGTVGAGDTNASASLRLPDIGVLLPKYAGALRADVTASQVAGAPIQLTVDAAAPYGITLGIDGQVGQGQGALDIAALVPSLTPFAPGLPGGISLDGSVAESADGWALDLRSAGPVTAATAITGVVASDGNAADVRIRGDAPFALINGLIAPTRLDGSLTFDLALNGPPGLDALSGTVSTSGSQFQIPSINLGLGDIAVQAALSDGRVSLEASARSSEGGTLTAEGPITLSGDFPADLTIVADDLILADPSLYQTVVNADVSVTGPVRGTGGTIGGRVNLGETELRIPSGGGFSGAIPLIRHVGEPGAVFATRERAGLINIAREARGGTRGSTILGLDLRIDAPQRIFVRGRGLDAELGGSFDIGGTTRTPAPVGEINVVRGRLDILGKRLDLSEDGRVTLGGDLVPFLELIATSDEADDFTILILIEGPVDQPEFSFSSSPPLPEDEVLARFFFDKGLANLSPLQAAQLANSIAQLTGRGGVGLLGGVREGLGVDDFNLVTDDEGDAALQIGQYLTDNIYTDVTTSTGGMTEVNINIDVTDTVTVKGSADNEGDTSLGIYFERDY